MSTTRKRGVSVLPAALVAGALGLTGLLAAGPAQADTQSYLAHLHDAGINTPRGELDVLEGGWEVCELFAKGFPPDRVMQQALYNSGRNPHYGLTRQQADTVFHFAVTDLCSARK
jgi:Protein of unknown function (DUF732)